MPVYTVTTGTNCVPGRLFFDGSLLRCSFLKNLAGAPEIYLGTSSDLGKTWSEEDTTFAGWGFGLIMNDSQGNYHIVTIDHAAGPIDRVIYRKKLADQLWSDVPAGTIISGGQTGANYPKLCIDDNDNACVSWWDVNNDLWFNKQTDGTWGTPEQIVLAKPLGNAIDPQQKMAIGYDGVIYIFYREQLAGNDHRLYLIRRVNNVWQTKEEVVASVWSGTIPRPGAVIIDPNNNVFAIYEPHDLDTELRGIWIRERRSEGGLWQSPVQFQISGVYPRGSMDWAGTKYAPYQEADFRVREAVANETLFSPAEQYAEVHHKGDLWAVYPVIGAIWLNIPLTGFAFLFYPWTSKNNVQIYIDPNFVPGGKEPVPSAPTDLLCEQKTNPGDVTDPNPEFSAIYHGMD